MLFQSYTGGRPAEFVYSSKGKASQDPLSEAEAIKENEWPWETVNNSYDHERDANNSLEYDDDSNAGDGPEFDDDDLFDYDHDSLAGDSDYNTANEDTDESANPDSGYSIDGTDITMIEDTDNY